MTSRHRVRRHRGALVSSVLVLALVSSACAGNATDSEPRSSSSVKQGTSSPVNQLTSIETLRDAFNEDAGSTRLILIISPT